MAGRKVGKKRFREAISECYGIVGDVCKALNISRSSYYNYLRDYDLKDVVKESRNTIVDIAESQLMRHVTEVNGGFGDFQAIKFVLSTFGKDAGWTTRTEITGADGVSLFGQTLSPDVVAFLEDAGIDGEMVESMAVQQFEAIVRSQMEISENA
jgi:hypothetical protein